MQSRQDTRSAQQHGLIDERAPGRRLSPARRPVSPGVACAQVCSPHVRRQLLRVGLTDSVKTGWSSGSGRFQLSLGARPPEWCRRARRQAPAPSPPLHSCLGWESQSTVMVFHAGTCIYASVAVCRGRRVAGARGAWSRQSQASRPCQGWGLRSPSSAHRGAVMQVRGDSQPKHTANREVASSKP